LLEVALPRALELASAEISALRQQLPRDYLRYMGVAFSNGDEATETDSTASLPQPSTANTSAATQNNDEARDKARSDFRKRVCRLAKLVVAEWLPLDCAADQMAKKQLLEDRLPPGYSDLQLRLSVHGIPSHAPTQGKTDTCKFSDDQDSTSVISSSSSIRLATRSCARMCVEDDEMVSYQ